ncbi:DBND1 protein, partial [Nyctibius grandis]|nr:DBND1 protein [Nyctibius grandis]
AGTAELGKEVLVPERPAGTPTHGPAQDPPGAPAEEQGGIPVPSAGLLQVTERRRDPWHPLSARRVPCLSLRSLPDPCVPGVFCLSLVPPPSPWGLQPVPRAGYLRSPSWTRTREQPREKKHLSDPELPPGPPDAFLPPERPRE